MPATTWLIYVPESAVVTRWAVSVDGSSGVPRTVRKLKNSLDEIHFWGGAGYSDNGQATDARVQSGPERSKLCLDNAKVPLHFLFRGP